MSQNAELTPTERLEQACNAFNALNRTLPAGMMPFEIPPLAQMSAGLDALLAMLIEAKVIDEQAYIDARTVRFAEIIEQLAEQARDVKRQVTGLVVAGAGQVPAGKL